MEQTIQIEGMTCGGCAATVERVLKAQNGVSQAKVDLAAKTAAVEFDPTLTNLADLQAAIEDAGYDVIA